MDWDGNQRDLRWNHFNLNIFCREQPLYRRKVLRFVPSCGTAIDRVLFFFSGAPGRSLRRRIFEVLRNMSQLPVSRPVCRVRESPSRCFDEDLKGEDGFGIPGDCTCGDHFKIGVDLSHPTIAKSDILRSQRVTYIIQLLFSRSNCSGYR